LVVVSLIRTLRFMPFYFMNFLSFLGISAVYGRICIDNMIFERPAFIIFLLMTYATISLRYMLLNIMYKRCYFWYRFVYS